MGDETAQSETIARLYDAFARRDGAAMAACYGAEAKFSDPVFPDLRGAEVGGMWRMLCEGGTDLRVEWSLLELTTTGGRVRWDAWYTFSATGRKVHNIVTSDLRLHDGLIIEQTDTFDFWRWSRQALGPAGVALGWTPFLRGKIQRVARKGLASFLAKTAAG